MQEGGPRRKLPGGQAGHGHIRPFHDHRAGGGRPRGPSSVGRCKEVHGEGGVNKRTVAAVKRVDGAHWHFVCTSPVQSGGGGCFFKM